VRWHGAALLPDGGPQRPGVPVALDQPAAPRRGGSGEGDRPIRYSAGHAGSAGGARSRRVAGGAHARPCTVRYRQRSSVWRRPGDPGGVLRLGRFQRGTRLAHGVSTWYFLALDRPTPPSVFISPVLAMLVTLGLGLVVVRRAQRRGATRSGV